MNAVARIEGPTSMQVMSEAEIMDVLRTSLYPGASDPSIRMVLGYCKATNLDPMQKPVHIVPMWDNKNKQMRDVVMPGVGLYRIQAARTGQHVGTDEPEFGPDVTLELSGAKVTVPDWCKVTVYRLVDGQRHAFTAKEFWIENYATASKDTTAPNTMWRKRARGQLAKCAEAQALRKGFPEVGSQPTADEMEGKEIDITPSAQAAPATPAAPPAYPQTEFDKNLPTWEKYIQAGKKTADQIIATVSTKGKLSDEQITKLRAVKAPQTIDAEPVKTEAPKADAPKTDSVVLEKRIREATDIDLLSADADLISTIADQSVRDLLTGLYKTKLAELKGGEA